ATIPVKREPTDDQKAAAYVEHGTIKASLFIGENAEVDDLIHQSRHQFGSIALMKAQVHQKPSLDAACNVAFNLDLSAADSLNYGSHSLWLFSSGKSFFLGSLSATVSTLPTINAGSWSCQKQSVKFS